MLDERVVGEIDREASRCAARGTVRPGTGARPTARTVAWSPVTGAGRRRSGDQRTGQRRVGSRRTGGCGRGSRWTGPRRTGGCRTGPLRTGWRIGGRRVSSQRLNGRRNGDHHRNRLRVPVRWNGAVSADANNREPTRANTGPHRAASRAHTRRTGRSQRIPSSSWNPTRTPTPPSSNATPRSNTCRLTIGTNHPKRHEGQQRLSRYHPSVTAQHPEPPASVADLTGKPPATAPDLQTTAGKLADLQRRLDEAVNAGSARAVEKQHARGKQTARERIDQLLDPGSFVELDELARHRSTNFGLEATRPYGDGVVTGYGTVDGRPVAVFSQDFTVFGGSLGEVFGEKILKVMDFAMKTGCPVIGINDSGGARIQEGVVSLGLYGEIFYRNTRASGVIPQISLIMGPCAGGAVYSPAITDFTVMVDQTSHMFITGPDVIKTVTGEDVGFEELGGARTHNTRSGNAHYLANDEADAIDWVKALLSYLPSNNLEDPPTYDAPAELALTDDDLALDSLIPDSASQPYDIHAVIEAVLDDREFLEVQPLFAQNIVVGFGRVEGRSVGVVANQPMHLAGTLDIDASEKAARFVRFCDAFNIPILTFVDVPGFLPGTQQEWNGIIRRGAKLLYAYAEATVPKVTVITRKAYGGAYDVMGSKHLGADMNFAWPTAQIAVMGAQGAVNILYRQELAKAEDPDTRRAELIKQYEETLANPYIAAERGYVDAVIRPATTRIHVVRALRALRNKRDSLPPKKHGNIPL